MKRDIDVFLKMRPPDGSRIDIGIYLLFAPALAEAEAFTFISASGAAAVVVFAVEAAVRVAALVVRVAALVVALVVARVAEAEARSALLIDGVLMAAAELSLVAPERPRPSWAEERLEITNAAMRIDVVIARRFIISDLIVR
jgi:hypothetical protein